MNVDGLILPDLLPTMLDAKRWPRTAQEASQQHLHSLIPEDRLRRWRSIYLYPPPFHTVADILLGDRDSFYGKFGALHELVPSKVIEIADFGLGADSPILLDYWNGPTNPRVIHLEWSGEDHSNYWIVMAPDFASFVEMLGL